MTDLHALMALPHGKAREVLAAEGKLKAARTPKPWKVAVFGGVPLRLQVYEMDGKYKQAEACAAAESMFLLENPTARNAAVWSNAKRG